MGRRRPTAVGLGLFVVGSAGCAMSTTVEQLTAWRVLQALGACVGPVLSRAMVRDLYGREQAAKKLSTLILIMGIAPLAGPLVGGQVLALGSWHEIFWLLAGIGLVTGASLFWLPESLPPHRRARAPLVHALKDYWILIQDPKLVAYAMSGAFFYSGVYAFIVGTPFAYIDFYGVSAQAYGWLFGINIVGMMAANMANARLLPRFHSDQIFRVGVTILLASGGAIVITGVTGIGGLAGLVIPVLVYVSMNGLIVANSVACALADHPQRAGATSSLLGALHYGSGIFSAALVGWFSDGTPAAMAIIMGAAAVGSSASLVVLLALTWIHRRACQ
ncbi:MULTISPECIES: multidrug effflux MFS transporter [Stenotrophomonas]|uniref:multidrug effflux MFS transporter n=1 Tax=Stenotrophomonas TaxID=40323 RepID=UPI0018FEEB53|nr:MULTISPECIES: multidrug effflux MFS transporter [Stenotrophomonas]MBN5019676.1 multidrug effflux MFS transporter [Stenotrophomonas maltophilia]MCU0999676.1 multidrug effflux MFS transporter [Stenotrophomonas maltophilia]